jgi:hypothetical protein
MDLKGSFWYFVQPSSIFHSGEGRAERYNAVMDALYQFFANTMVLLMAKGSKIGNTTKISYNIIDNGVKRIISRFCTTF